MQLHKAQGGGGRGGSACDRGAARDAGGAGLGPPPPPPPGEEAGAWGSEPGAAAGGCKRRPGSPRCPPAPHSGPHPGAPRRSLPGPGAGVSVPSFRAARVDPGGSAEKLPPFRGASERRGPAALGPRWLSGPFPGRSVSGPLCRRPESAARRPHVHRPPDAEQGTGPDDPRGLFRPGLVGGRSARPRH